MGKTVAIVGAGIVGVSTALWLARAGHRPVLVDRAGPGAGASFGNGGVLAAAAMLPVTGPGLWRRIPRLLLDRDAPLFLRWGHLPKAAPWLLRYLANCGAAQTDRIAAALRPLVQDSLAEHRALAADTPAARFVQASEYVYLYPDRGAHRDEHAGWEMRRAAGYTWREMDRAALHRWAPALSGSVGFGVALPDHGYITDPGAYVETLAAEVTRLGGTVMRAQADAVLHAEGRVTGLRADGQTVACDAVLLAAGAWSGPLARQMGLLVPLESERGYHIDLHDPSLRLPAPVMVTEGQFVITPMAGRLRLAGVLEIGGLDRPPAQAPLRLLRRHLQRTLPGLTWKSETTWMGHRPATPDSLPLIGPVPRLAGAFAGFGHHHVGLTAGAVTGRWLAQMIGGRTVNHDLSAYAPDRFASTHSHNY